MKTLKYFIAILFITFSSLVLAGGDTGYNLKFKVKGLPKDSACYLAHYYADINRQMVLDTTKIGADGLISFTGKQKLKEGLYLLIMSKHQLFNFFIDDDQDFSMETDTLDFTKHMKVKGSEENKVYYEYMDHLANKHTEIEPLLELRKKTTNNSDSAKMIVNKMDKINKEVKAYMASTIQLQPKSLFSKFIKSMIEPEVPEAPKLANGRVDSTFGYRYMRAHYWDNFDFSDERMLNTPVLLGKMKHFLDNLTYPIPDSLSVSADIIIEKARANKGIFQYVVGWAAYNYESAQVLGMDAVFVHLVEKYFMTNQAFWVDSTQLSKINQRAIALKPLLIGKYAPNLAMKDSAGHDINLYDLHSKFTVLYFWDYGCSHCKKVTPKLLEWYHKVKSKGVEVFAVGTETNAEEWKKYIKENKLDWINVYDPFYQTGFKKTYDITSTPKMFILDENKKILSNRQLEVDQLDGFLEYLINQKAIDKTK
jgi:peroxiredoxin